MAVDRFRRNVLALALGAVVLVASGRELGPTAATLAWIRLSSAVLTLAAVVERARREPARSTPRRGWGYVCAAVAAALGHDVQRLVAGSVPLFSAIAGAVVLLAGIQAARSLPGATLTKHQATRESTETVLVAGSVVVVIWSAHLGSAFSSSTLPRFERVAALAFPAALLVSAIGIALLAVRTGGRRRKGLLLAALTCVVASAGEYGSVVDLFRAGDPVGSALSSGWAFLGTLAFLAVSFGATRPPAVIGTAGTSEVETTTRRYVWALWAVPAMAGLGFSVPRLYLGTADRVLLVLSAGTVCVSLVHQVFMQLELQRLLRHLDRRVAARTAELRERNLYYQGLFEHSADVVLVIGADGRFSDCTPSLQRVLGWDPTRVIGRDAEELLAAVSSGEATAAFRRAWLAKPDRAPAGSNGEPTHSVELIVDRIAHRDGRFRSVEISFANHLDDSAIRGVVATLRDVTVRLELESELAHQAFHDQLTGLPNRTLFRNAVERALLMNPTASLADRPLTVMFLDLNGFKGINDTFGHPAGDALLQAFSSRIRRVLGPTDTFARLGGDEFAILLERGGNPRNVASGIYSQLDLPFSVAGTEVSVSTSIGIADSTTANHVDDLLRNADVAMYRCKQSNLPTAVVFRPEMHEAAAQRLQLQEDLRRAIDSGGLDVWLQPVVDMADGAVEGFEALVRWNHPVLGRVPPSEFVPLAEESGLIESLGALVLRRAANVVARENRRADSAYSVAVNISAKQLENDQFASMVERVIAETGLRSDLLVLEITESMVMKDPIAARAHLERLASVGVRIALDDFGTGYSSLAALSRFPLNILKVDRAFVAALSAETTRGESSSAAPLLAAIEEIGRALGLTLVAEGVETTDECDRLLTLGFSLAQGYLFGEPMPPIDAFAAVDGRSRLVTPTGFAVR